MHTFAINKKCAFQGEIIFHFFHIQSKHCKEKRWSVCFCFY